MDAFQNVPIERAISAREVVVWHVAIVGRVEHSKRGDEHVFRVTCDFSDDRIGEKWEEKPLNAYAVRDEFLKVKDWSGAFEFLSSTGRFSPVGDTITWSEFQRWQRFVYLVQEHNELAQAMQDGRRVGEHAEVLKALSGDYPSSFFDSSPQPESAEETKLRADPKIGPMIQEGINHHAREVRELLKWFREPPRAACSNQWVPKLNEDALRIRRKLQAGGVMIEFLLHQSALRPVLLITPSCTLQAIAAAIYGDRINGVEYRTCEACHALFPLGAHKEKKFCDREVCKNKVHQRNRRAAERARNSESAKTRKTKKGKQR